MHELSIALALVQEVERIREKENAAGVASVTVTLGPLCGVDPHALEFAYPVAAEGSALENAPLRVHVSPALCSCKACGAERPLDTVSYRCAACGSDQVAITGGRDFLISSVELLFEDGTEESNHV